MLPHCQEHSRCRSVNINPQRPVLCFHSRKRRPTPGASRVFTAPRAEGELNETADKCVSLSGSGDEVPSRQSSAHTRRSQEGSRDPGTLASLRCQVHRCHLRNSEAQPGSHGQGFEDLPHHTSPPRQSYILIQEFAGGISTNFINFSVFISKSKFISKMQRVQMPKGARQPSPFRYLVLALP